METAGIEAAVDRLKGRLGETLRSWGPERLEPVLVERFREAIGVPSGEEQPVPPTMLMHLGGGRVDVERDVRPREVIDDVLLNPVNGGTSYTWLRPLKAGDEISGTVLLKDAYLREGRSGPLAMVITQTRFSDGSGEDVAVAEKTMIYRGAKT